MKIIVSETHPPFRFTDIYPFVPDDAPDSETALSGHFSVVHPTPYDKEGGIRINLARASREPYTLKEIETYIQGLQKAVEVLRGLGTAGDKEAQS